MAESVIATMRDSGAAKSDNAKVGNSALSHDICLPVLASEHGLRCGLLCIHCGLQIVYVLTYHMFTVEPPKTDSLYYGNLHNADKSPRSRIISYTIICVHKETSILRTPLKKVHFCKVLRCPYFRGSTV